MAIHLLPTWCHLNQSHPQQEKEVFIFEEEGGKGGEREINKINRENASMCGFTPQVSAAVGVGQGQSRESATQSVLPRCVAGGLTP